MSRASEGDPFLVIGPVPKGKTYQWGTVSVLGSTELGKTLKEFKAEGWKPVLARRHPRMRRNKSGHIVVGGQILLERSQKLTQAARDQEIKRAKAQFDEHPSTAGEPLSAGGHGFRGVSSSSVAPCSGNPQALRDEIEEAGGAVKIEIGIVLSEREIDAAAYLGLTAKEYARRKVLMLEQIARDGSAVVLREIRPGAFDLAELKIHYPRDN